MEKRIQLEKRGRPPGQIQELNLDNCRSTNIVGLTDEFTALETLSLINVGLTTLKGFPKLPNLKKLELSDNRISNGLNYLTTSPKLTNLNLSGNKIKDLETLKPLENFQNLEVLDLFNNEATSVENYRGKIFAMIPSLKYLDGFDANEVEAPSDGDHDSEDDEVTNTAFCINGLEIDLDELENFEKKIAEKKSGAIETSEKKTDDNEPDDLDELLERLKLNEREMAPNDEAVETITNKSPTQALVRVDDNVDLKKSIYSSKDQNNLDANQTASDSIQTHPPTSLPVLMFFITLVLSLVNYTVFSEEDVDDDDSDDDDVDEESYEEDNGDLSLSDVYNDELEEDNSEWGGEENEAEEDDDDFDKSDEEEGDEAAKEENQTEAEVPDDSQARGKKRKHEG